MGKYPLQALTRQLYLLDFLRMPFDTTETDLRLALSAGMPAASLSTPLLYFSGWITTPGVFRILGRVRSLHLGHGYRI